jgi:hypothetical protein
MNNNKKQGISISSDRVLDFQAPDHQAISFSGLLVAIYMRYPSFLSLLFVIRLHQGHIKSTKRLVWPIRYTGNNPTS